MSIFDKYREGNLKGFTVRISKTRNLIDVSTYNLRHAYEWFGCYVSIGPEAWFHFGFNIMMRNVFIQFFSKREEDDL